MAALYQKHSRRGEAEEDDGPVEVANSDEELCLLASDEDSPSHRVSARLSAFSARRAAGYLLVAGVAAVMAAAAFRGVGPASDSAPPAQLHATARSLLEGTELADITTRNLLALHGDDGAAALRAGGEEALRGRVVAEIQGISRAIEERLPEAHHQMSLVEVSPAQSALALDGPRRLGDSRLVGLAREVALAAQESEAAGGGHEGFKKRLVERLQAKIGDLQQLSGQEMSVPMPASSELSKWHPHMDVTFGRRMAASSDDAVKTGVQVHVQTLLESLHTQLGDRMPEAPARMLSFFDDDDDPYQSHSSSSSSSGGDPSFMSCVTHAVPDPMKVCKCIADNMSEVMSMVKKFMMGK